jgi:catechol 2,3-dioxygenase-like lactoylglutathione lyase family enzyme
MSGIRPPMRVYSYVCENPPWQATRAQCVDAGSHWLGWTNEWKVLAADFQCTVGHHVAFEGAPTADFICSFVFRSYGCYGLSFRRGPEPPHHPKAGGHCVAMRNGRDGRLHLFDPNYFHVAIRDPDHFRHFVKWWLRDTGYHKRYRVLTGVAGIRPPINHSHP